MDSQQIGGRYTILERIGKGAMGVVFKAYDPILDRVVAIKKMAAEIGQDEELRQRFYVEARAAARLNHRNIVTIHELEEADGEIYIVMEMLEGVDLATVIRRKVKLPLEAKLSVIAQLCEGLDYAHRHGIVHRDVKPGNVHLSPNGVVKILDFGIARLASSKMTGTGALLGTPDYMSPEQVMGEEVDARSDLFAVGGVLYELLAAAKAFESDTVASLLIKIAKNPHVPITDRVSDLPVALVSLVNRLLAKDRDQRPPTAAAVVAELQACLLSVAGGSDAAAIALVGGIVTEQTIAIKGAAPSQPAPLSGTPRPVPSGRSTPPRDLTPGATPAPAGGAAAVPAEGATAGTASNARLASLALQRGRELRKTGDVAGAIEVFRSVLEVAPGNPEALDELHALERDIREATSKRASSVAADAGATVLRPRDTPAAAPAGAVSAPAPAPTPSVAATADAPAASAAAAVATVAPVKARSGSGLAIAAALLVVAGAAAGGGYYLLVQNRQQPVSSASNTSGATSSTAPAASSVTAQSSAAAETSPAAPGSVPAATVADAAPVDPTSTPGSAVPSPSATPAPATAATAAPESDKKPATAPAAPENSERVRADQSRTRLDTVKRASLARRPPPARLRMQVTEIEREANAAYARGDYTAAAAQFENAAKTIETAEAVREARGTPPSAPPNAGTTAVSGAPTPRGNAPRNDAAPPRPVPAASADPASVPLPPVRDSSPVDISTFNRGAPTTVDQMFNATPSIRATIARIKDVIERYARAMEQRDGEAVRSVRDDLNPVEQRIVRQGRQVTCKFDEVNVRSDGQQGMATARRTLAAELESGEKINVSGPVTIRLVRRPAGWVITDIR